MVLSRQSNATSVIMKIYLWNDFDESKYWHNYFFLLCIPVILRVPCGGRPSVQAPEALERVVPQPAFWSWSEVQTTAPVPAAAACSKPGILPPVFHPNVAEREKENRYILLWAIFSWCMERRMCKLRQTTLLWGTAVLSYILE